MEKRAIVRNKLKMHMVFANVAFFNISIMRRKFKIWPVLLIMQLMYFVD